LAFHLTFGLADRTLTTLEVDAAIQSIEEDLKTTFQAAFRHGT
jgi:phenylalanyl-tRNA synthetase beta subunit